MDPNQDGFVSKTTAGFSNDGYYVDEFEITMFGIPQVSGDVAGDNTGSACGITDLTPDSKGHSVYAVRDGNNLIFRFRVGDNNPSVESWTILLDTDGLYGAADPNATANNPGFEADITLIKRNNAGVYVYRIDGIENCPTPLLSYPIDANFQISIADEVSCGDPDYFYDFYVPFDQLASAFGISGNTGLRFVAVSNVSATCAMAGQIADVSGVDNDFPPYANCIQCAFTDLVDNQCPTAIDDLCQTCGGFEKDKVNAPTIDVPVRAGQGTISGTCDSGIYIVTEIYSRVGGTDAAPVWSTTPRETQATTATGTNWIVTLSAPLQSFDKIIAKAQKSATSVPCGVAGGNQASASVTVVQPNTAPVAQNQNVNVSEDTPTTITLAASDAQNDPLIFTISSPPLHGTLTGTVPNIIYTPASNYSGPDSFTFQVSDGIFSSASPGTVSITVSPVNDAPVANNQNVSTAEDVAKLITLSSSDVDGGAPTYTVLTSPLHGVLSGSGATITYTPASNYNGSDSFTFKANDGLVDSSPATISITVTPVADAPVANNQSISILEEEVKSVVLTGSDVDGDALTFIIVSAPGHGTLTGSGPNITYTPSLNYNGADSFTFKANDGSTDSNVATVSITIGPVNDPPIASNQSVTTPEDIATAINLTANDVDANPLTYSVVSSPLHGTLSGTAPALNYTPDPNYNGPDNFTFKVNDGSVDSNLATISITITPVNDAPTADTQSVTTAEDVSRPITLTGSDTEGSALTYAVVTPPAHGSLTGTAPTLNYTPDLNYNGSDVFTFKVNDGSVDSNIGTINVTITSVNDAPVANGQSATYLVNTPKPITLTGTDVEGDALTYIVLSLPGNGTLTGTAPNVTYTPNVGYMGPDSFTFKVNDGSTDSNIATVSLFLTPGSNVPPTADSQSVSLAEDTPTAITLTASDANADPLTFSIVAAPSSGTLTGSGSNLIYSPNLNFNGSDSFTFKVNDGSADSNIATVSITVTSVNDAPVAIAQSVSTPEETAKGITLAGSDVDLDALSYSIVVSPAHGILTGVAPNITYTPATDFSGQDSFSFKVNDGTIDSAPAIVSITVTALNDLPVVGNQNISTSEDVAINITFTGSDADLDALSYSLVGVPLHGSITGSPPNVSYTPALNYNGTDLITFKANDGTGDSNIGSISITITPVNDLPSVGSQSLTTAEDSPLAVSLAGTDPDGDALSYVLVTPPLHGTLSGTGPALSYLPSLNYNGSDSFSFMANDGNGNSNVGTIAIDITPAEDAPVAFDQGGSQATTPENVPIGIGLVASDPDGDPLTFIIVTPPAHGALSGAGSTRTYTPTAGYSGPDSFTFKVNDGITDSNIATVSITVTPVADAPVADSQSLTLAEDTQLSLLLTASDLENDPLTYVLLSQVTHGSLVGILPALTYTPKPDFNGTDNITFKVNDGAMDSNIATIIFTVTPVNDAPFIMPLPDLFTPEDSTLRVCLNAVDVDGDAITFGQPINNAGGGTMVRDKAPFDFCYIFTPAKNFNGQSLWTMSVSDATGLTATAAAKITVTPVNDPPNAVRDVFKVYRNVATEASLLANDSDIEGDKLTVNIKPVSGVLHGQITLRPDGTFTYTSDRTYRGLDSLVYEVCDNGVPSLCSRATAVLDVGDEPFKVYEGVSPNGDGANEYLRIEGIDYYTNNSVQIFDRFENLVFEMNGYDNEERVWRGQANKGVGNSVLPEGTYFYIVKLGDGSAPVKGFVVLKRQ